MPCDQRKKEYTSDRSDRAQKCHRPRRQFNAVDEARSTPRRMGSTLPGLRRIYQVSSSSRSYDRPTSRPGTTTYDLVDRVRTWIFRSCRCGVSTLCCGKHVVSAVVFSIPRSEFSGDEHTKTQSAHRTGFSTDRPHELGFVPRSSIETASLHDGYLRRKTKLRTQLPAVDRFHAGPRNT